MYVQPSNLVLYKTLNQKKIKKENGKKYLHNIVSIFSNKIKFEL